MQQKRLFYKVLPRTFIKLVLVSTTFALMTEPSKEDEVILEKEPYIHYPLCFCKNKENKLQALIDSGNRINAMRLAYISKIDLWVRCTNVRAQKINGSTLKTFGMILANFQVEDKIGQPWYFQETLLLAGTTIEVVLKMFFPTFSNADILF